MMGRRMLWLGLVLATLLAPMAGKAATVRTSYESLWTEVQKADNDGLPKTAIEALEKIERRAKVAGDGAQYLRALSGRLTRGAGTVDDPAAELLKRAEAARAEVPPQFRPLYVTILATWYWQYFEQNRWRFSNRSATTGLDDTDFTTWDLPRLFKHVSELYDAALADRSTLQGSLASDWKGILVEGSSTEGCRPTLFDFVVHTALAFYGNAEQPRPAAIDAWDMDAASGVLASTKDFASFQPDAKDPTEPMVKAVCLLRDLVAFHLGRGDATALVDAELSRLAFVREHATGPSKDERYAARLDELMVAHRQLPVVTRVHAARAELLHEQGDLVTALKIAEAGAALHPASPGAGQCRAVAARIRAKELTVSSERSYLPQGGSLALSYRNVTRIHFRVVRDTWDAFLKERWGSAPDGLSGERLAGLLKRKPVREWSVDLPPTADYKTATVVEALPTLEPGFYRVVASWKPTFDYDPNRGGDNAVRAATMWVSGMTLVPRRGETAVDGLVLDAVTGEPLSGVTVTAYEQNDGYWRESEQTATGDEGMFSFSAGAARHRSLLLTAVRGADRCVTPSAIYNNGSSQPSAQARVAFFSDRAIYRPGQPVRFKAVFYRSSPANDDYRVLPAKSVKVQLFDRNSRKVEELELKTNRFGSVSGTFTAPSGTLLGAMSLRSPGYNGMANLRVEEYKRPKFLVSLESPAEGGRLGDTITAKGTATAYTGAPIDGATVKYRVTRQTQYPWWCSFWWSPPPSQAQEIAQGTVATDVKGSFAIPFEARPDPAAERDSSPTFTYVVSADVTDTTGETRTATTTLRLGWTALEARLTAPDFFEAGTATDLALVTTTLDGRPAVARGSVEIVKLKGPAKPAPRMLFQGWRYGGSSRRGADPSRWESWEEAGTVATNAFSTNEAGQGTLPLNLPAGAYRAKLTTKDRFGATVEAFLPFLVVDPTASRLGVALPSLVRARSSWVEVGGTAEILWGTGYDTGRALVEIEHRGSVVKRYWTQTGSTQHLIRVPVGEEHRGGFTVHVTHVRENRLYASSTRVEVPWSNKRLTVTVATHRSALEPGTKEAWTLTVKGPDAAFKAAELVATMYDASLDAFAPLSWSTFDGTFRRDWQRIAAVDLNQQVTLNSYQDGWNSYPGEPSIVWWHFAGDVAQSFWGYGGGYRGRAKGMAMMFSEGAEMDGMAVGGAMPPPAPMAARAMRKEASMSLSAAPMEAKADMLMADAEESRGGGGPGGAAPDLDAVEARTELGETAFFEPHVRVAPDGTATVSFTAPQALTTWNFLGLAHGPSLESGMIRDTLITRKDLMVQPTAPRFLREKDVLAFTAKVINMSKVTQTGTVRLSFRDALTETVWDEKLGVGTTDRRFDIPAGESRAFSWRLTVPVGTPPLTYKLVAASDDRHTDGEEGTLPVLSGRVLVTESMPLPIRGPARKNFTFRKLLDSGSSTTLTQHALTVQMVSNPAWYAVQALPYLMEYPHECSEQVFNRLYANALASHIASSDPRIKEVFRKWKGTDALDSNLEKNQDLKAALLVETPWVLEAKNEKEAKHRVGRLFETAKVAASLEGALKKLADMQDREGGWPWFPGGRPNDFITLYLMTGFGRLRHLEVDTRFPGVDRALAYMDSWLAQVHREILRDGHPELNHMSSTVAMYLYGRTFFLPEKPVASSAKEALAYFVGQAKKYWLSQGLMAQGHLTLALSRLGEGAAAAKIVASLRERAQHSDEMGMFWSQDLSWWWYHAPIETQAVLIEVFDEVAKDVTAVDDCQTWLLKQKQTQNWKTTKATADAVYALLMRGPSLLASDELVEVVLGGVTVEPTDVEPGTGFYEQRFTGDQVRPAQGNVTVVKKDAGVAWGSVHWQYFEDLDKVTPHATPLSLDKKLFVERSTDAGPVIEPVTASTTLKPGDLLKVRIILKVDRDMEYVHLKDGRGSGTEPTNVLSGYKWQDGMGYYEATGDTATNFFIDWLSKGTHVFEYPVRVVHEGAYQSGMAQIQCMYAPEFNSHSGSVLIRVGGGR